MDSDNLIKASELSGDILQVIPDDQIPDVLEILKKDWPQSLSTLDFIETHVRWKRNDSNERFYLLCPRGDWKDGTVIAIYPDYIPFIVVYTLEDSCERLREALQQTRVVNWNYYHYRFPVLLEKHYHAVIDTLKLKGLKEKALYPNNAYFLLRESALKLNVTCPEHLYIAPLKLEDAPLVDSEWPGRMDTSLPYVERLIKYNFGLGLYTKEDSKLICWAVVASFGVGMLHTLDEYRRKGYATILMKHIFKRLGEMGNDVSVHAAINNVASNSLLRGVGCEYTCVQIVVKCDNKP